MLFVFNDPVGNGRKPDTPVHKHTVLPHSLENNYAALARPSPARWSCPTQDCFPHSPRTLLKNDSLLCSLTLHSSFSFSSVQTGGSGGSLTPLVDFYSKLPKGPAPQTSFGGLKARYFTGKNASAAPILATILGIFTIGYTIDYQSAYHVGSTTLVLAHTVVISPLHMTFFFFCGPDFTLCAVHLSAS